MYLMYWFFRRFKKSLVYMILSTDLNSANLSFFIRETLTNNFFIETFKKFFLFLNKKKIKNAF